MADLLSAVRGLCLALPEATEGVTHGAPTWFVRGRRSFAKFVDPPEHRVDEPHVALWAAAPPGARHELVAAPPRVHDLGTPCSRFRHASGREDACRDRDVAVPRSWTRAGAVTVAATSRGGEPA